MYITIQNSGFSRAKKNKRDLKDDLLWAIELMFKLNKKTGELG